MQDIWHLIAGEARSAAQIAAVSIMSSFILSAACSITYKLSQFFLIMHHFLRFLLWISEPTMFILSSQKYEFPCPDDVPRLCPAFACWLYDTKGTKSPDETETTNAPGQQQVTLPIGPSIAVFALSSKLSAVYWSTLISSTPLFTWHYFRKQSILKRHYIEFINYPSH